MENADNLPLLEKAEAFISKLPDNLRVECRALFQEIFTKGVSSDAAQPQGQAERSENLFLKGNRGEHARELRSIWENLNRSREGAKKVPALKTSHSQEV
jgi:hypothetical protein